MKGVFVIENIRYLTNAVSWNELGGVEEEEARSRCPLALWSLQLWSPVCPRNESLWGVRVQVAGLRHSDATSRPPLQTDVHLQERRCGSWWRLRSGTAGLGFWNERELSASRGWSKAGGPGQLSGSL